MIDQQQLNPSPSVKKHRLNVLPPNPEVDSDERAVKRGRFPSWLHRKLPKGSALWETGKIVQGNRLHTVCEEAKCPNLLECWSKKTATFLVMGKECTRSCGFCDIAFTKHPEPLDPQEPERVAESVKALGLKHVVITMVARDDLPDGGATHLAQVVQAIRASTPGVTVELLASDLNGNFDALEELLKCRPEIYNHNLETVRALTPRVRHRATYERTLSVLEFAKHHAPDRQMRTKSGIMVGLGETEEEVKEALRDLQAVGCDIVTIGQYLQASPNKLRVKAFITPEQFEAYAAYGRSIGIPYLFSGPFVRSSYNAAVVIEEANGCIKMLHSS